MKTRTHVLFLLAFLFISQASAFADDVLLYDRSIRFLSGQPGNQSATWYNTIFAIPPVSGAASIYYDYSPVPAWDFDSNVTPYPSGPGASYKMSMGAGSIWILDSSSGGGAANNIPVHYTLYKGNATAPSTYSTYAVNDSRLNQHMNGESLNFTYGGGFIWVYKDTTPPLLVKLNLNGTTATAFNVTKPWNFTFNTPQGLAYGGGYLWTYGYSGPKLSKIDPNTGAIVAQFNMMGRFKDSFGSTWNPSAEGMVFASGKLYLWDQSDQAIWGIDQNSGIADVMRKVAPIAGRTWFTSLGIGARSLATP